jgi:hypothetical protein
MSENQKNTQDLADYCLGLVAEAEQKRRERQDRHVPLEDDDI